MVDRIEKSLTLIADEDIPHRLKAIEDYLKTLDCVDELSSRLEDVENALWKSKDILTTAEAAKYLGFKLSYLYKLTADNKIPFYKPTGGSIYFCRQELVDWVKTNEIFPTTNVRF